MCTYFSPSRYIWIRRQSLPYAALIVDPLPVIKRSDNLLFTTYKVCLNSQSKESLNFKTVHSNNQIEISIPNRYFFVL